MSAGYVPIRAPRGNVRTAKGWIQEAAKRMLMNNLDAEVADKPEELIVYGGRGKAARNWERYYKIVETLDRLENNQTLLVQFGRAALGSRFCIVQEKLLLSLCLQRSGFFLGSCVFFRLP